MRSGPMPSARKDVRKHAFSGGRDVQDDENCGVDVPIERLDEGHQRLNTARGGADHHDPARRAVDGVRREAHKIGVPVDARSVNAWTAELIQGKLRVWPTLPD